MTSPDDSPAETPGESLQENSVTEGERERSPRKRLPRGERSLLADLPPGARTMRNLRDRGRVIE